MSTFPPKIRRLSEMVHKQEGDCFVMLTQKERHTTKEGKPYYRLNFCDSQRDVQCPVWSDSGFFEECEEKYQVGNYYKIRIVYRETSFGPKVELKKIREVVDGDKNDGFDPYLCRPCSAVAPEILLEELTDLARAHLGKNPLLLLIQRIFKEYRPKILLAAASRYHHHAYAGGLLEHTLSVTRIVILLYEHYCRTYPRLKTQLSKPLLVAGAILHDIGKIIEMEYNAVTPLHTTGGELIGHPILGRDLVQKYAPLVELDPQIRFQLEHIILAHPRFTDWGAVKPPMSLEAMIVHHADYSEATLSSALHLLDTDDSTGDFTYKKGPFGSPLLQLYKEKKM